MSKTKFRVRPEGRPDLYVLDADDVRDWLDAWFEDTEHLHNMIANDGASMFLGADWGRDGFDRLLDDPEAGWAVTTQPGGIYANHALVCVQGTMRYIFDVGRVTDDDLEIIDTTPRPWS